jgi:hypothetical protein
MMGSTMSKRLTSLLLLPAALVLLTTGCSKPGVSVVKGKVYYNNQPLSGAEVEFKPETDMTLGAFIGQTDADGNFEIKLGKGTGMNARPGKFVALITKGRSVVGMMPPPDAPGMTEEQRIKAMMEAGPVPPSGAGRSGVNTAAYGILPIKYSTPSQSPFKVEISEGMNDLNPFRLEGPPLKK